MKKLFTPFEQLVGLLRGKADSQELSLNEQWPEKSWIELPPTEGGLNTSDVFYFCLSRKSYPLKPGRLKYQSYNLLISLWALDGGERRGTKILNLYFVKTMPN